MQLNGQVAIVTGASSGIGRGIAGALAGAGAAVVLTARRPDKLEQAREEIQARGGSAVSLPADVTDEPQVMSVFHDTMERFGRVDIVVNNAGVAIGTPAHEITLAQWRDVLEVNLTAAFLCSREALRIMRGQRRGRIVNIGSISAKVPRLNSVPYTASKAGLEGMTRAFALEAREFGVTVGILHPGNTMSAFWAGREQHADSEGVMSPDDVARMVLTMVTLPQDVLVLESVMLPLKMPFLGRG